MESDNKSESSSDEVTSRFTGVFETGESSGKNRKADHSSHEEPEEEEEYEDSSAHCTDDDYIVFEELLEWVKRYHQKSGRFAYEDIHYHSI